MSNVDLTNCDREPIHIIGHVQPHGVLMALDRQSLAVHQTSLSVEAHFGLPPERVIDRPFLELLPVGRAEAFVKALESARLEDNPTHLMVERLNGRGPFHLVAHIHDGVVIVEAEPADETDARDYRTLPRGLMRALQNAQGSQAYYDAIVREARVLTGFDRAMLYRFTEEGTGVVVAEAAEPHLDSYLGLHYPASDIPQQARRLFALNTVRLYPDVDYEPSPLVPPRAIPLDMTYCALRGVSSMHTKYLQNMGVRASMALAITQGEMLWGLVALHHYEPRTLPYPARASCELLAGLASMQVAEKERSDGAEERERMRDTLDRLIGRVQIKPQLPASITEGPETVSDLIDAGGVAVLAGGEMRLLGETPGEDAVRALVEWLNEHQPEPIWTGEALSAHYPPAQRFQEVAAGLLSAQISRTASAYVLWFRPERVRTVDWAGDPNKPVEADGETLSPRASFAAWSEEIRGRAKPWTSDEKAVAERLRLALVESLIHRADEILRLNEELGRRNEDLDTFAHVAAHDLKEPLRGIRNYAQFLEEDYGDRIDEEGKGQIATILRLSTRLEGLIDSLLRFARLTREELGTLRCDLGHAVSEAETLVASAVGRVNGRIVIEDAMPTVQGDEHLVAEVFVNLFTNALKYNESPSPTVTVSLAPSDEGKVVVAVRDNGIGIPERHLGNVFTLFKRLHAKEAFGGGTGMGLTIVKRAIERLGGRVWIASSSGEGSTFFLEFIA